MKQQVCSHTSYPIPPIDKGTNVRCGQCKKNFQWDEEKQEYIFIGTDREVQQ